MTHICIARLLCVIYVMIPAYVITIYSVKLLDVKWKEMNYKSESVLLCECVSCNSSPQINHNPYTVTSDTLNSCTKGRHSENFLRSVFVILIYSINSRPGFVRMPPNCNNRRIHMSSVSHRHILTDKVGIKYHIPRWCNKTLNRFHCTVCPLRLGTKLVCLINPVEQEW